MALAKTQFARALARIKLYNGLSMDQLAKELGCSERTLSRYIADGAIPRNNEKGERIWKRADELLKQVPSGIRARPVKRGRELGEYMSQDLIDEVREFMIKENLNRQDLSKLIGINYAHLCSILNQKTRTSQEMIDRIVMIMRNEKPVPIERVSLSATADQDTQKFNEVLERVSEITHSSPVPVDEDSDTVSTYQYEIRPDTFVGIIVPADLTQREAERLAFFIQSLPKE